MEEKTNIERKSGGPIYDDNVEVVEFTDEVEYTGEGAQESLERQPNTDELVAMLLKTRMGEVLEN